MRREVTKSYLEGSRAVTLLERDRKKKMTARILEAGRDQGLDDSTRTGGDAKKATQLGGEVDMIR